MAVGRTSRIGLVVAAVALLACGGTLGLGGSTCDTECTAEGLCGREPFGTADGAHRCFVRSTADCRASAACAAEGRCVFDPEVDPYACSAAGAEPTGGCGATRECVVFGRCRPELGRCVAEPGGVSESLACRVKGACTSLAVGHDLGVTPEGCAASVECALTGRCVPEATVALIRPRNCVHPETGASSDWRCMMRCQPDGACIQGDRGQCLRAADLPADRRGGVGGP